LNVILKPRKLKKMDQNQNRQEGSWQPLRHDDPYFDDSPIWLDENGCVCWAGAYGETNRLVLHGDMALCLFVERNFET
jgi:hypothetical protein